jgi:hypothetical protein
MGGTLGPPIVPEKPRLKEPGEGRMPLGINTGPDADAPRKYQC